MPNYEYKCPSCGHRFEIWQEVGAAAPPCEQCQSAVKKVLHAPRVIFKGSGFYLTDLRAEQSAATAKKENAQSAKENSSDKSSSDKPASSESQSDSTAPISDNKTTAPASSGDKITSSDSSAPSKAAGDKSASP